MNRERLNQIDKLRFFAILGVILVHTTTRVLERTGYDLNVYWSTLFLNQLARFAVPLFFLISGFVLEFTYKEVFNPKTYIKKRVSKIVIPYIFWSLIYYYFIYTTNQGSILYALLTGNASYQLYFIPTLCIFYLLFPIIHKSFKVIGSPIVLTIITLLQFWILHTDYVIKNLQYVDPIRISILGLYFFVIGIVVSRHKDEVIEFVKKWKVLFTVLFMTLGYYIFREGITNYYSTYNINAFYSSWRPSTLLYSLVSFTLFTTLFEKFDFHKLSKLSFLVFFIHVAVLEFVWKYIGNNVNPNFYFDVLFFALVSGISFSTAALLHKIPHVSKVIG